MNLKKSSNVLGIVAITLLAIVGYMFWRKNFQNMNRGIPPKNNLDNCSETTEKSLRLMDLSPNAQIMRHNGKVYICPKGNNNIEFP
jgi:hypothetical protein